MIAHPIKIPENMDEDIRKYMKELGYASFSEFARDAIREKLYGRELRPEFEEKIKEGLEDLKEGRVKSHEDIRSKFLGSTE